jgi:hypothetical protein
MEFLLEKRSWPDLTKIRSILLSWRLNHLFFRLYSLDMQVFWNRRIRIGFEHVENLVLTQIRLVILVISWKRKKIYILFFSSAAWCYIPTFGLSPALLSSLPQRRALDLPGRSSKKLKYFLLLRKIYIYLQKALGWGWDGVSYIKEKKHLNC